MSSSNPPVMTSTEAPRGRRKGDISFSTARFLVEKGDLTYEALAEAIDNGEGEKLGKLAKDLEKKIRAESSGGISRGGRPLSEGTKAALSKMGISIDDLERMDEKTKNSTLTKARAIARSIAYIAEYSGQRGTNVNAG